MPRVRDRILHPEFFTDGKLADAELSAGLPLRVAYAGLWCVADREGRFEWKPRELKLVVLPYDPVDMAEVLDALAEFGFVRRYEVGGVEYGWIPTFAKWQHVHPREAKSKLPEPPPLSETKAEQSTKRQAVPRKSRKLPGSPVASTSTSTSTSDYPAVAGNGTPGGWPAEWAQDYARIGELNPGHIGKRCAVVVAKYGHAHARRVWRAYIRARPHMRFGVFDERVYDVTGMGPEDFVKTYAVWAARVESAIPQPEVVHAPAPA